MAAVTHSPIRAVALWAVLGAAIAIPVALSATSPLLAWRGFLHMAACYAGIAALCLVLLQPLLIEGHLPGLTSLRGRRAHLTTGRLLAVVMVVHVGGLWIVSPPDMLDALLFTAPTWFSLWGVIAMWAIIAVVMMVAFRRRLRLSPRQWRQIHQVFAAIIVVGGAAHAVLIEGIMEFWSKAALCALTVGVGLTVLARRNRHFERF